METIKEVLMRRDKLSEDDAEELIQSAKADLSDRLERGEMPQEICADWFGLEEDYVFELL